MAHRPDHLLGAANATFTARLDRWVADARIAEASLARSRERWLREIAEQDATVGGVLADLAERREPLLVHVAQGRSHHGIVRVIGADFIAMTLGSGAELLLVISAIELVRAAPAADATIGDRVVGTDLCLSDVLAELAADRARVVLRTSGADRGEAGQLRGVGHDVALLRSETAQPTTVYVALRAVTEVRLN